MDITEEILQHFNQSWVTTQEAFGNLIDDNPQLSHLIPIYNYIPKLKKGWLGRTIPPGNFTSGLDYFPFNRINIKGRSTIYFS